MPLIAAAANSFKRTFVRVYLGVSGASRVTAVSGTLTASRQDGSAPGGPESIASMNSITVDSANTFVAVRSSLAASLNFELPLQWLSAGQLHLQLGHLDIEDVRSTFPCIDCENPGPAGPSAADRTRARHVQHRATGADCPSRRALYGRVEHRGAAPARLQHARLVADPCLSHRGRAVDATELGDSWPVHRRVVTTSMPSSARSPRWPGMPGHASTVSFPTTGALTSWEVALT